MKEILLSGVKPTGKLHIGNYFGAMRQFLDMQNDYDSHIFIADLHALTSVQDPNLMKEYITDLVIDYLAVGLDPKKVTLFQQSAVPQVTELAWIFNCMTTMPYLMRAHAFKDAEAKNKEINVGVFDYPILMAADILLPNANVVPVGKDQKQHVEIARDIAEKFNRTYGETFTLPKARILEETATIVGTDGQKMSKSYNNTISLFGTDEEIKEAVMKIPTDSAGIEDSKNPDASIIYQIHSLLLNDVERIELRKKFTDGGVGYKQLKDDLISDLQKFISPIRQKREDLIKNKRKVLKMLEKNNNKMHKKIEARMKDIRKKVGLTI